MVRAPAPLVGKCRCVPTISETCRPARACPRTGYELSSGFLWGTLAVPPPATVSGALPCLARPDAARRPWAGQRAWGVGLPSSERVPTTSGPRGGRRDEEKKL